MEALKKKRAILMDSIKNLERFAKDVNNSTPLDDMKTRVSLALSLHTKFIEAEDKIISKDPTENSELICFEDVYCVVLSKLNAQIRMGAQITSALDETQANQTISHSTTDLKLPRMNLPQFDGSYKDWQSFFDLFSRTVHENGSLSAAQKFQLLKSSLKGEAFNLLKHIAITEVNYLEAFRKLRDRYNKPKQIISTHIQAYLDIPHVKLASATSLRKLTDQCDEVIRALKAMGSEAESRDQWLINIIVAKLDDESRGLWALHSVNENYPTIDEFISFMNSRCDALEACKPHMRASSSRTYSSRSLHIYSDESCSLCKNQTHPLYECSTFKDMSVHERRKYVKENYRCFNCMSKSHPVFQCKSQRKCSKCRARHHGLLHLDGEKTSDRSSKPVVQLVNTKCSTPIYQKQETEEPIQIQQEVQNNANGLLVENYQVFQTSQKIKTALLPTVLVNIKNGIGENTLCRCLLDSGSQLSIITESCLRRLRLPRQRIRFPINGLGSSTVGVATGMTNLVLSAVRNPSININIQAVVMQRVTSQLPLVEIDISSIIHLDKSTLADPNFHIPGKVDLLIGSEHFFNILKPDRILNSEGVVQAQATVFGWVIAGQFKQALDAASSYVESGTNLFAKLDLESLLRKFWETEEVPRKPQFTAEELACEEHFVANVSKNINGRFKVKLPFKQKNISIGTSRHLAVQRLLTMERRFQRDDQLRRMYVSFMKEYEILQHMVVLKNPDMQIGRYCYLPHHGVMKEDSTTTRLRVVFDASVKSSSGTSLNDYLMVGPTIQRSLISILLRFRLYKIVFTSDLEKMYRQILVDERDAEFQRIVWRESPQQEIKDYKLTTVTYGTASAPFLATRVLQQIAEEAAMEQDETAKIILNDFYVDDILTGVNEIADGLNIQQKLLKRFHEAGFKLRKWSSNSEEILNAIPKEDRESKNLELDPNSHIKTLGLHWNPKRDVFFFKISLEETSVFTKRNILSEASKLFNPLGWLAPITITIKIFFQRLWLLELSWDYALPVEEITKWIVIKQSLPFVDKIEIPRWLMTNEIKEIELCGFADASELAYGAVIYCRISNKITTTCNIIAAKTKVTPIKQVCVPRLELCAAQLLVKLFNLVKESLKEYKINFTAWTDSTIVLAWLSSHPRKWSTYVANRVSEILETTSRNQWRHVRSPDNPADIASRGLLAPDLINNLLWWYGPNWLAKPPDFWPKQKMENDPAASIEERTNTICSFLTVSNENKLITSLAARVSRYSRILRIICWVKLYVNNLRSKNHPRRVITSAEVVRSRIDTISFNPDDINKAERLVLLWAQEEDFSSETRSLKNGITITEKRNPIKALNPFVDSGGLLRVGGRLENSSLQYNAKHPIIVSGKNLLIRRLVQETHRKLLHAGMKLLKNSFQEFLWVLGIDKLIKRIINECLVCFRHKQTISIQLMGSLPDARVTMAYPFSKVGVDYAGPIMVREHNRRGHRTTKAYVAIFVCLCTKAVHIEPVGNMTTESFLAALTRFTARRGLCSDLFSDNGSNFIGARNQLHDCFEFLSKNNTFISNFLVKDRIAWHMIPPAAPSFGGLWEAAVKSMKFHLRRVLGQQSLTFEELETLLVQIEGIMNSRPIYSTTDGQTITPSHFLIGRSTTSIPQPVIQDKMSLLSRWRLIEKLQQDLWSTWHKDYLRSLQKRNKWQFKNYNLKMDDVVIIKEETMPPSR